jgi:hypothetical protein
MHSLSLGRTINLIVFLLLTGACNIVGNKSSSPQGTDKYQPGDQRLSDPYNRSALANVAAADSSPLYVAMGGWNSCVAEATIPNQPNPWGMNMNKGFSKLMKHMAGRQGVTPRFVLVCHNPDASRARYILSNNPTQLKIESHNVLYQDIAQYAQETKSPVVILGHSYGGAFAMHAALELAPQVAIAQFITIDAISPVNCPPTVMAKLILTRVGQITGIGNMHEGGIGCQQSPREFSAAQLQTIKSRVGWWQNYYQSDLLSILKADAISDACNTPVQHESIGKFINGHIAMGMYDKLWGDITSRLTSPLPTGCLAQTI